MYTGSARSQEKAFNVSVMKDTLVISVNADLGTECTETSALTSMSVMNCSHVHSCVIIPWAHTNATAEMAS